MFTICAVDPGVTGAIAFAEIDPVSGVISNPRAFDLPLSDLFGPRPEVDEAGIHAIVAREAPRIAVIEHLVTRGGSFGKTAQFSKGKSYVAARSALRIWFASAGRPCSLHPVAPDVWKRALDLTGTDKDESLLRAIARFPDAAPLLSRKKDHDRAEALLLIAYYADHLMRRNEPVTVI